MSSVTCQVSHIRCHMSGVKCQLSCVMCHVTYVICNIYFFYKVAELVGWGSVILTLGALLTYYLANTSHIITSQAHWSRDSMSPVCAIFFYKIQISCQKLASAKNAWKQLRVRCRWKETNGTGNARNARWKLQWNMGQYYSSRIWRF